jgi:hypothetical protein
MERGMRASDGLPDGLPSVSVIACALRKTTERLTREVAAPRTSAPDWNDFEWAVARAVCAMHGITALLAARLIWRGPPSWENFLREQRPEYLARHEHIGDLLRRLERAATEAGLPYVALKGAEIREHRLHHPGERPMGDVDLLVRPADAALAARVIGSLDYTLAYQAKRHDAFVPRAATAPHAYAESAKNPLRIELHSLVSESLPVECVDITSRIWPARIRPGNNRYASFASLLLHVALHTSGNMRANAMRFIQIYDCALLSRRMGPSDWEQLMTARPSESSWWLFPALSLAERYVPGSVPAPVLDELTSICPGKLRERYARHEVSDVSWSNLRIPAVPGMEWSRSAKDSLRLAFRRAWPGRIALAELSAALATQPRFAESNWYRASRAGRIVRWISGRAARVQTLCAVTAALKTSS